MAVQVIQSHMNEKEQDKTTIRQRLASEKNENSEEAAAVCTFRDMCANTDWLCGGPDQGKMKGLSPELQERIVEVLRLAIHKKCSRAEVPTNYQLLISSGV